MGIFVSDKKITSGPISLIKAQRVLFAVAPAKPRQFQDRVIMAALGACVGPPPQPF